MLLCWVLGNCRLRKQRKLKFETVPDDEQMEMAGDPFVVDVNDVNKLDDSYVVNNRVKHNPGFYAEEEKVEEFVGDQDWDWKPDIHKHSVPKRPVPPKDMFRLKANDIAYIHKDNWTQV